MNQIKKKLKFFFIKKNYQFQEVFKAKKKYNFSEAAIFFNQNVNNKTLRFGIVVSKKIKKKVTRNLVKRQVRVILRVFINENVLLLNKPLDVIILIKTNFLNNKFAFNKKILLQKIKKIVTNTTLNV